MSAGVFHPESWQVWEKPEDASVPIIHIEVDEYGFVEILMGNLAELLRAAGYRLISRGNE